ncbi:MAG: hypothetical protein EAZ18_13025 [Oscillatoriales cyanobacterium]|nr:MAG: hypothetical protein EAZ18_13025 [Oscillatoriales cyanobacterium]
MDTIIIVTPDEDPQPEGIYWCCECQKSTNHSHCDPHDMEFYERGFEATENEPDILKCDRCVRRENNQFTDG